MLGLGSQRSAIDTSRDHVNRLFWLRRRSARIQRRITNLYGIYRALAGCAFDALPLRRLVNEEDERSGKEARSGTR
jgi:hypothetical protein